MKIAPLRAPFPSDQPTSTDVYDYGSDSDLEDEDEDEVVPETEEIKDEDKSNVDQPTVSLLHLPLLVGYPDL